MRRTSLLGLALIAILAPTQSFAQAVAYHGKLKIGFGDQDNATGFRRNDAVPICAGGGELVNPGTIGTTLGTLLINAQGTGAPGVGGTLTFNAVGGGHGGAQQRTESTCLLSFPGFVNPRLRSRTTVASAHFPGRKGAYTPNVASAPVPATPTATYMLSAGGGYTQSTSVTSWTTMATDSATANAFTGAAIEGSLPFFGAGLGVQRIQPGAARFGGALPYSGGGGLQLGVNFVTGSPPVSPTNYGHVFYANGFFPQGPQFFGTDAKGVDILSRATDSIYGPLSTTTLTYDFGLIAGRQDATYAARTPGGSTKHQQGAIRTLGGGNTATPVGAPGLPITSPIAYTGLFGEWTTGSATHTDKVGDFTTVRKAAGFDVPTSTVSGATRRIQLVTPWSASIRAVGPFGLPAPNLGFGGVAVMTIKVIPAPEPGTGAVLIAGSLALAGLRRIRA